MRITISCLYIRRGAWWLSGRVLDLRSRGAGSRLTRGAMLCPWGKHFILCFVLDQPRNTGKCPVLTLLKNCWLELKASTQTSIEVVNPYCYRGTVLYTVLVLLIDWYQFNANFVMSKISCLLQYIYESTEWKSKDTMYALCLPVTLCRPQTPKRVLLQTVSTQMKYHIMFHFVRFYTIC